MQNICAPRRNRAHRQDAPKQDSARPGSDKVRGQDIQGYELRTKRVQATLPVFGRGIDLCIGKIALKFHSNAESDRRQSDIRLFIYENTLQKGAFAKIKSRTAYPLFVKSIRIVPHYIAVGKHRVKDVKIAIS